ncbi:MAG: hypothetical protein Q4G19_06445 [Clostridia bacterium]|nr:hypothetical protein [Clostridia bacterium]
MADENKRETPEEENEVVKMLRSIGSDLWGGLTENGAQTAKPAERPAAEPEKRVQKAALPEIERIWETADETIDWTDALVYDNAPDGLTGSRQWAFFKKYASAVLSGDLKAYAAVLTAVNPLGDLTVFTGDMKIRTPGAERLEAVFEVNEAYMKKNADRYMAGLSLRIARDLFAVLPVSEVGVEACRNGEVLFSAGYTRDQMRKRSFVCTDPASFAKE